MGLIEDLGQKDAAEQLRGPITELAQARSGFRAALGALPRCGAPRRTWVRSAAMNRIYEVDEGRPVWKLRLLNILVSLIVIVGAAILLLSVVMTGAFAEQINERLGLLDSALTWWNSAKWPLMLLVVAILVASAYYATPNVRQPWDFDG